MRRMTAHGVVLAAAGLTTLVAAAVAATLAVFVGQALPRALTHDLSAASGTSLAATGPVSAGSLVLEPARHEARVGETALALTPTEFRLLEALVRANGDIVPHHLLARAGWPAETDPDLLWLKPHLARLRAKVQDAGGPEILAVRGVGYRIETGA